MDETDFACRTASERLATVLTKERDCDNFFQITQASVSPEFNIQAQIENTFHLYCTSPGLNIPFRVF